MSSEGGCDHKEHLVPLIPSKNKLLSALTKSEIEQTAVQVDLCSLYYEAAGKRYRPYSKEYTDNQKLREKLAKLLDPVKTPFRSTRYGEMWGMTTYLLYDGWTPSIKCLEHMWSRDSFSKWKKVSRISMALQEQQRLHTSAEALWLTLNQVKNAKPLISNISPDVAKNLSNQALSQFENMIAHGLQDAPNKWDALTASLKPDALDRICASIIQWLGNGTMRKKTNEQIFDELSPSQFYDDYTVCRYTSVILHAVSIRLTSGDKVTPNVCRTLRKLCGSKHNMATISRSFSDKKTSLNAVLDFLATENDIETNIKLYELVCQCLNLADTEQVTTIVNKLPPTFWTRTLVSKIPKKHKELMMPLLETKGVRPHLLRPSELSDQDLVKILKSSPDKRTVAKLMKDYPKFVPTVECLEVICKRQLEETRNKTTKTNAEEMLELITRINS